LIALVFVAMAIGGLVISDRMDGPQNPGGETTGISNRE
jgi:hypothetical protein